MLQPEESNKNRLALIADNELRHMLTKEESEKFMLWWSRHRNEVGWKRLAKLLTVYAKEFKPNYVKEETKEEDYEQGTWLTDIEELEKGEITNGSE